MFERDFAEFAALLDDVATLKPTWKPLPPKAKALFFKAFEQYPLEVVSQAMTAHLLDPERGQFQPAPADLMAQIKKMAGADNWPGAEEAWAIALTSQDESATVIWTQEIAEAFGICRPVLDTSGAISARKAFIEAYERLVGMARINNIPAQWSASLGWDADKREEVLRKAAVTGLLPAPAVRAMLPNYSETGAELDGCPEGLKRVKEELARLQDGWAKAAERREAELLAEREAEAKRKADIAAQVQAYESNVIRLKAQA